MIKNFSLLILQKIYFAVLCSCLLLTMNSYSYVFDTLDEIASYAEKYPEDPPVDNDDLLNPDFSTFYQQHIPNLWDKLLTKTKIHTPTWSLPAFEKLANVVIEQQEARGYLDHFVVAYAPGPHEKFIIWGGLYGAFHSLVRSLQELKKQHILQDDLTIAPNYSFIFNGNVINLSAYILETLTVILQLIRKNPDRVFYIRGSLERGVNWKTQGLGHALKIRGEATSDELPYEALLTRILNTLPESLYLQGFRKEDDSVALMLINGKDEATTINLQEQQILAPFLRTIHELPAIQHFNMHLHKKIPYKTPPLVAVVGRFERNVVQSTTNGLLFLGRNNGRAEWNIFSAPIFSFEKLQNFTNDAFVKLTCARYIDNWMLTLFARNRKQKGGFVQHQSLNLTSGYPEKIHHKILERQDFFCGTSVDLSKSIRIEGQSVKDVTEAFFDLARREQLIPGLAPYVSVLDDGYEPVLARQNTEKFLRRGINRLLLPMGSPTVIASLDYVKEQKMLLLFPLTGASFLRDPKLKYVINLRSNYSQEGYLLTKYIIDRFSPSRFALFYQDDAYGQSLLIGARRALYDAGIQDVIELPYQRNDVNFPQQVRQIVNFFPSAIGLFSTTTASEGFIRDMGLENLTGKLLYGNSFMGEARFKFFLKSKGLTVAIVHPTPNPRKSNLPIVKEFREFVKKSGRHIPLDAIPLESYMGIKYLFHILKKIAPEQSNEEIVNLMQQTKDYDIGGIVLNFNPESRELLSNMWIDEGTEQDWVKVTVDRNVKFEPYVSGSKYQPPQKK